MTFLKKQDELKEIKNLNDTDHTVDDGLNVFVQTFNNITGVDKSNDGIKDNKDKRS